MNTSIPAIFNSCFNTLKTICSRLERESASDTDLLQISRWQDELGRLRLWAANIGAHRTGQSSLEFRLKDSSHIREQVTNLLLDLGQTFQEVEDVLDLLSNGHASQMEADNSSDDDYDTGEELTQLHSNIVTAINCLFQMSMLVRKPARHDFYILPQSQEVLAFRPFDQAHVREKYPKADQGLVDRLGLAITLRRQYLRYRERHHAKLNQGLDVGTGGSAAPTVVMSDTIVTGVEPWHIDSQDKAPASVTSQTSYAPSMLAGGALVIPSPPKESSGGAPFECPYCFVMISVDGTPAWHKHVFQDLQPYICTVAACSTPHTLFSTRHEWVQHLKEAHPLEWTGNENRAGAAINEADKSSFCAICPLCRSNSESEKHFVRHLARHSQELALFVLPQDDADSDIETRDIDAASDGSKSESSDDDSDDEEDDVNMLRDPRDLATDETAELFRQLEKFGRGRAEQREKEVTSNVETLANGRGLEAGFFGKSSSESSVSSTVLTNPGHDNPHDEQQLHDRQSDGLMSAAKIRTQQREEHRKRLELFSSERGRREEEAERLDRELELPSRPRQASFDPMPATVSRLPRDDELYVMQRFARHASHCTTCAHPYTVHKTGRTLCPKGHQRAIEVTDYVIAKEGKPHSVVDLEGNKRVEIEIPPDCGAVRELLKALERGLRLFEDNDNEAGGAPSGGTFLDDDDDFSRAIANGMREQEEQEESTDCLSLSEGTDYFP